MSKGFILVDVPDKCSDCRFCSEVLEGIEACCELEDDFKDDELIRKIDVNYTQKKPDWCPIREFPERRKETLIPVSERVFKRCSEYATGWNNCLKTIISNQEERDNAKDV